MKKILIVLTILALTVILPVEADEWTLERITNNPLKKDWPMGITADGTKILYISETDYNDNSNWDLEVFLTDLTTGNTERITYNIYGEVYASISDDGDKIAYITEKFVDNGWGMYVWVVEVNLAKMDGNSWISRSITSFEKSTCDKPSVRVAGDVVVVGCGNVWYLMNPSGNALREIPRHYPSSRVSGGQFVYVQNTKFYQSESNLYPSELNVLELPYTAGIAYSVGENRYIGRSFDVSSDGAVAFLSLSLRSLNYSGIYQYDGNIVVHKYVGFVRLPYDRVRISGDGSKVFYQGWNNTINNPYSVIYEVSDGKLEPLKEGMLLADVDYNGNRILVERYIARTGHSDIFVLTRSSLQPQPVDLNFDINFMPAIPAETTIMFQSSALSANEVQIPVKVKNANGIGSMNIELEYPNIFEAVDVVPGSLTQNSLFEYNIKNGRISVGVVDTNGITGDGSLLYVRFKIVGGNSNNSDIYEESDYLGNPLKIKKTEFDLPSKFANTHPLLIREATLNSINGSDIEVIVINGTFKFLKAEDVRKGDINGDGEITSVDALAALQMSVGILEPESVADMDDDGNVRANDAMKIMKIATQRMVEKTSQVQQGFKQPKLPLGG